jgi:hypothetical protein
VYSTADVLYQSAVSYQASAVLVYSTCVVLYKTYDVDDATAVGY